MSENLRKDLEEETEKWLKRIKSKDFEARNEESEEIVENIRAYVKDSEHFLEEEKLIEAFEAAIWAWSWYEIGVELELIEE